jgi:response regulator RpfG family c-di-GMP phosphodiesterase
MSAEGEERDMTDEGTRGEGRLFEGRGYIVCVDDDLALLQTLEEELGEHFGESHEVLAVTSAEQAPESMYELARQGKRFEVVISDLMLPGMHGDRMLEIVNDRFPGVIKVLLTGHTDLDAALYAIASARIDKYIAKPWQHDDLTLTMAALIQQHRLRRENEALLVDLQDRNRELAAALEELREAKDRSEKEFLLSIQSLAVALEAKDRYTAGHSERVARFSVLIGRKMGFTPEELEDLRNIALLHDIGKIGMADAVLNKPGALTDREFAILRDHPVIGAQILSPLSSFVPYILATKHHHERFDGRGYPDGLSGNDLPLTVWIIAIADAFDAMTSTRPYRKGKPISFALQQLQMGRGTQFHPDCADAFIELLQERQMIPQAQAASDVR